MKLLKSLTLAALAFASVTVANIASAQIKFIGGAVHNASLEDAVYGAIGDTSCTLTPFGTPAWSSPSTPASLTAGGSVTWGYNNGSGTSGGGQTAGYQLRNVAFRNVIRGGNNNGGVASAMSASTLIANKSSVQITIWGPSLNAFGVNGANNFTWEVRDGNNTLLNWGSGETTYTQPMVGSPVILNVKVTASDPNELGSVFVSYTI